jgi:hypothetical protein
MDESSNNKYNTRKDRPNSIFFRESVTRKQFTWVSSEYTVVSTQEDHLIQGAVVPNNENMTTSAPKKSVTIQNYQIKSHRDTIAAWCKIFHKNMICNCFQLAKPAREHWSAGKELCDKYVHLGMYLQYLS